MREDLKSATLQLALAAADLATWQLNFPGEVAYLDARWARWLGREADGEVILSFAEWRALVHPDDWPWVRAELIALLKGSIEFYVASYRLRSADGRWVWLEDRGRVTERDPETGRALAAIGVSRNVTQERLQAEAELRLRLAAVHSPVAIVITDADLRILWANPAASRLFGVSAELLTNRLLTEWLSPEQLAESKRTEPCTVHLVASDGLERAVEWNMTSFQSEITDATYFVYGFHDVTARVELERQLRVLAHTDSLTQLPNRRAFFQRLEEIFERFTASPTSLQVVVALIDLDHFKRINDTFGHAAGDVVLRDFARLLRDSVRSSDLIGRLGGEEFGVVIESPAAASSEELIFPFERMRAALNQRVLTIAAHAIRYSCSMGITPMLVTDADVDSVLARADAALYRAKQEGRNRIVWLEHNYGV